MRRRTIAGPTTFNQAARRANVPLSVRSQTATLPRVGRELERVSNPDACVSREQTVTPFPIDQAKEVVVRCGTP
jgi:hypothetical protein